VFLSRAHDFVLAAGDDTTDEDLFRALPPTAYSLRVGLVQSQARYNLAAQADVIDLIGDMAADDPPGTPEPRVAASGDGHP